ncbi:hypothetical protein [Mariniflexile sp.]|uniref:hypothetical protein n=1 Tax=Mariniflexile sp. TaxID=1979402 RepID=UPI004048BA03
MKKTEEFALSITSEFFKLLIEEINETFKTKHALVQLPKNYQLYGYGDFDESKPSLKSDFEVIGTEFINGKYLYDKTRQAYKGRPVIRLSKYYKSIILLYLGYADFKTFINENSLGKDETREQLALLYDEKRNSIFYYISYYYGEDNKLNKGQTIISEDFKKVTHAYVYPEDDGSFKTHHSFGTIVRREDTLHIKTKTLLDGKLVEGGSEIYYIGHNDPSNTKFLIGTYCTFDIYTQTVAGKSIFEKCESREEMEAKSKDKIIPAYIAQELRKSRIINPSIVPKDIMELSNKSPYASIYNLIPGNYVLKFELNDSTMETLKFKISGNDFTIKSHTPNVYFENENFQLNNKGSIVHFSFKLVGIIALDCVDIYFKTYFLKEKNESEAGVFSGVDNENRLVNGHVFIEFSK